MTPADTVEPISLKFEGQISFPNIFSNLGVNQV